jgi:hypothetical protein
MRADRRLGMVPLAAAALAFSLSAGGPAAAPPSGQPLFLIERSKNANEVHYEARFTADGGLDDKNPVHAFWINWAEDPAGKNRSELSFFQKKMAFGFSIDPSPDTKSYTMRIVCCKDRPITVSLRSGVASAETAINGRTARLKKIKVVTREKKILPQVLSVTIFGTDTATGGPVEETITPR